MTHCILSSNQDMQHYSCNSHAVYPIDSEISGISNQLPFRKASLQSLTDEHVIPIVVLSLKYNSHTPPLNTFPIPVTQFS